MSVSEKREDLIKRKEAILKQGGEKGVAEPA